VDSPTTTTTLDVYANFEGFGFGDPNGGDYSMKVIDADGTYTKGVNPPTRLETDLYLTASATGSWELNVNGVAAPDLARTWDTGAGESRAIFPNPGQHIFPRFMYDKSWNNSFSVVARDGGSAFVSGSIGVPQFKLLDTTNNWS
jgi:hypothetical protein